MKTIKNITVLSLMLVCLSSCSLYSKFESPALDEQQEELYSYIQANQDTTTIASMPWKSFFSDPNLVELIEKALENNTDMNIAKLSVDQAQVALNTARLAYIPSLNFTPSASYSSFKGNSSSSYNISIAASWEIDLFGKLRNAKQVQKSAFEQSKVYKDLVQTQIISSVANCYYSLLLLDEQLKISYATKENWAKNLAMMQALMDAGQVQSNSVLSTKASYVALEGDIAELKQQIINMESTLCNLMAIAPSKIKRGELLAVKFANNLAVGVPLQLVAKRADIKVAEWNLAQAFYTTLKAKGSLYPSLSLSGSAGYTNSGVAVGDPAGMIINAAANLVQPIFNGNALRAQVKISKQQQEQALLSFKQTVLDAGSEVNSAILQIQTSRTLIENQREQIALRTQALKNTELLMEHGNVNYLEVLTSQLTLLQSELSLSADIYSEVTATIELYRALGGGAE